MMWISKEKRAATQALIRLACRFDIERILRMVDTEAYVQSPRTTYLQYSAEFSLLNSVLA